MIGERGNEGLIKAYPSSLRGHCLVRGSTNHVLQLIFLFVRGNEGPLKFEG